MVSDLVFKFQMICLRELRLLSEMTDGRTDIGKLNATAQQLGHIKNPDNRRLFFFYIYRCRMYSCELMIMKTSYIHME